MTIYWLLFLIPAIGTLTPVQLAAGPRRIAWLSALLFVVAVVGLRYEVGGDWDPYLEIFDSLDKGGSESAIAWTDPGYALLNWISARLGWGIYGVNLACGTMFAAGLAVFSRAQPKPWLAWLIATPYMLIVVLMGYSRQGVALGLLLWGLVHLQRGRSWRFVAVVAFAALFHKSAAVMLPLGFLTGGTRSWLQILGLAVAVIVAALGFLLSQFEALWSLYVEQAMTSEGAGVRVAMNALPAAVMLLYGRRWRRMWPEPGHWRYIAFGSLACILFVSLASTAVDRVALYFSPLQMYVWTRFPYLFRDRATHSAIVISICGAYGLVLWIWLMYAGHSEFWLPYKTIFSDH